MRIWFTLLLALSIWAFWLAFMTWWFSAIMVMLQKPMIYILLWATIFLFIYDIVRKK